jgi:transposase-like protein/uncharacterized protein YbaR (Trm112 family)
MVADADRAGAVIVCPNCRRNLRVPSGKGRGVELAPIPAAAKTQSTRVCERCGQSAPVDAQMCPHCRAVLAAKPSAPAAAPAAPQARPSPPASTPIVFGGSRATWWTRLSTGGKAGIFGGIGGFVLIMAIVIYFVYSSWLTQEVTSARDRAQKALAAGRQLENEGKLQEAYDLYYPVRDLADTYLSTTGRQADLELVQALSTRVGALHYIVPEPRVRESLQWKPTSQEELDQATRDLIANYPAYRQRVLAIADSALAAIQSARAEPNQTVFTQRLSQTMDAFFQLVSQMTPQQQAQFSFPMLVQAMRELTGANLNWQTAGPAYLRQAEGRFNALKKLVQKQPGTLEGDKIM